MKMLSLFLALNIFFSGTGITVSEHICSMEVNSNQSDCCKKKDRFCNQSENKQDCCRTKYLDFLKQDIQSYQLTSSKGDFTKKKIAFCFPVINPFSNVFTNHISDNRQKECPPLSGKIPSQKMALLQVFRC